MTLMKTKVNIIVRRLMRISPRKVLKTSTSERERARAAGPLSV